jgi:hypothetical protein
MRLELDQRHSDGVTVTLYHDPQLQLITLDVIDERDDTQSFEVVVDAADASHAFQHPYLYQPVITGSTAVAS